MSQLRDDHACRVAVEELVPDGPGVGAAVATGRVRRRLLTE